MKKLKIEIKTIEIITGLTKEEIEKLQLIKKKILACMKDEL